MEELFNIDLDKISNSSNKEALDRKKNLELFFKKAFLTKKMKVGNSQTLV